MLQSIMCLALMLPVCSSQPEAAVVSEVACGVLLAPTEPAEDMITDKEAVAPQPPAEDLETCRAGDESSSTREVAPLEKQEIGKTSTDESMQSEENAQSEQPLAEDLEDCQTGDENSSTREVAPLEKSEIVKTSADESVPPVERSQPAQPAKTPYLHEEKRPRWLTFLDSYWKWGGASLVLLVLFLCLVWHSMRPPRYSTGCPDNRCPRCGWRLDEGQDICRNCHTRF